MPYFVSITVINCSILKAAYITNDSLDGATCGGLNKFQTEDYNCGDRNFNLVTFLKYYWVNFHETCMK